MPFPYHRFVDSISSPKKTISHSPAPAPALPRGPGRCAAGAARPLSCSSSWRLAAPRGWGSLKGSLRKWRWFQGKRGHQLIAIQWIQFPLELKRSVLLQWTNLRIWVEESSEPNPNPNPAQFPLVKFPRVQSSVPNPGKKKLGHAFEATALESGAGMQQPDERLDREVGISTPVPTQNVPVVPQKKLSGIFREKKQGITNRGRGVCVVGLGGWVVLRVDSKQPAIFWRN